MKCGKNMLFWNTVRVIRPVQEKSVEKGNGKFLIDEHSVV